LDDLVRGFGVVHQLLSHISIADSRFLHALHGVLGQPLDSVLPVLAGLDAQFPGWEVDIFRSARSRVLGGDGDIPASSFCTGDGDRRFEQWGVERGVEWG
jgi:hypothetical protein